MFCDAKINSIKYCDAAVWQDYEVRVNDEFVLRGNAGLLKCLVPSYVSDVVGIEAWLTNQGDTYETGRTDWGKKVHQSLISFLLFYMFSG